jgi:ketosteroid isomerase-like protein
MDSKEIVQKVYDLFGKGDMEGFMNMLHDDFVFIYPGDKHPFSGTHNKEGYQKQLMKVPELWSNFHLTVESMISEGDKVFVNTKATADGMDTIFGHYMEVKDDKLFKFVAYDDTLSAFNAMKK